VGKLEDSATPSEVEAVLKRCWPSVSSVGRIARGRRAKELGIPVITGCSLPGRGMHHQY
jgi:hypothetical protein